MSKDLFLMMREEEVATSKVFPTKKELQLSAKKLANKILEEGNHNIKEVYAQSLRLKEAISTIESVLKNDLMLENFNEFGLKGTYRSGGDSINYEDDPIYADLKKKLKDRENILKTALKSDAEIYDSEGVQVPKVSTTPRKSSLAISF